MLVAFLLGALFWGGALLASPDAQAYRTEKAELFYYPSGRFLKEVVLGYDQAASALAWLRTVQYYGEHARSDQKFDMMYHLCDITTELDPRFEEPYTFGSFVLLTEGKRPSAGMALLAKGRENNPRSWKILFETGFSYYICWEDYPEAGRYFTEAAAMPGAPEYASRFAAWVTYRAGELETSLLLWQELAERTTNPELRKKALTKVEELTAQIREANSGR
jgi:hypothetical protein